MRGNTRQPEPQPTSDTDPQPSDTKRSWWRHAFAIDRGEAIPTPEQQAAIDHLCHEVARRGLTTPVSLFLSMSEPLNYVSAQVLHFLSPFLSVVSKTDAHKQIALFLEQRQSLSYIIERLEVIERQLNKQNAELKKPAGPPEADSQSNSSSSRTPSE